MNLDMAFGRKACLAIVALALLAQPLAASYHELPANPGTPLECGEYALPEELWIGAAGIRGLEGVALPGESGAKELGFNAMAAIKWFVDNSSRSSALFKNSTVMFSPNKGNSNGDPRRALTITTEIVNDPEAEDRLIAFFGGISSEESKAVQLVASTFGYSQVSPVSEGHELSDKIRYPTFNRVFAPSFKAVAPLIDIIKRFGWSRVGIVAGHTPEDFGASRAFKAAARDAGIQVSGTAKATSSTDEAMQELVDYINIELSQIRIWVMFFGLNVIQPMRFFSYAAGTPLTSKTDHVFLEFGRTPVLVHNMFPYLINSTEILPETWGLKPGSLWPMIDAMSGLISVTQSNGAGSKRYETFLGGINALGAQTWLNPPFGNDVTQEVRKAFEGIDQVGYWDMVHSTATLTVDALESIVQAAEAMVDDGLACRLVGPTRNYTLYLEYLRRIRFDGVSGLVQFDQDGDRLSDFAVFNLQFDPETSGRARLESIKTVPVLYWRLHPPEGEPVLVTAEGARVQWRDGAFSPPAPPPVDSIDPVAASEAAASPLLIAAMSSLSLLLVGAVVVSLIFFCQHRNNHHQLRSGMLSPKLLDIDHQCPARFESLWIELDGIFMMRNVSVHIPYVSVEAPDNAILVLASHPLLDCPRNGMLLLHPSAGRENGCVSPPTLTRQASSSLQADSRGSICNLDQSIGSRFSFEPTRFELGDDNLTAEDSLPEVTALDVFTGMPVMSRPRLLSESGPQCSSGSTSSNVSTRPSHGETEVVSVQDLSKARSPGDVELAVQDLEIEVSAQSARRLQVKATVGVLHIFTGMPSAVGPAFPRLKEQVHRLMQLRSSRLQPVLGMTYVSLDGTGQAAVAVVTEKFSGGNLHDLVHNVATPLDLDVRIQILLDIAKGLGCLHSQNPPIVYSGISMHNVLLQDDLRVVLSRYGFDSVDGVALGGSLQYAAPEVLMGNSPTEMSDVYSWAMLASELLERRRLYAGMSAAAVLTGVRDGQLRPELSAALDAQLVELVMECSVKNPNRRPRMEEIIQRLKDYQEELKLQASDSEPGPASASAHRLLHSIFPSDVAKQLADGKRVEPEHHQEVTIFFSDIVGFTAISSQLEPGDVMEMLDRLYQSLDKLTAKHGLFKVETIGDAYMAVGNLHPKADDHALRVARFAIDAIEAASKVQINLSQPELGCVNMRCGFHTGPVVASVVGNLNPRYCLFGDTVNTASRMESTSKAGKIHCSQRAFQALMQHSTSDITCERRKDVADIKGKGQMVTYFVTRGLSCDV